MTDENLNSFTIEELLYYLFFGVMLTVKGLGFYDGQKIYTVSLILGALLIIAKIMVSNYTVYEWLMNLGLIGLAFAIYFSSGEIGPFIIVGIIVGMKNVSLKRIMMIGAFIWTVTMTVSMLLVLLGLKNDIIRVQEKLGLTHIIRYSLGSTHPNVLQISTMLLCAFWIFVLRPTGRKLITASIVMVVINVYVFIYSVSYTGFALAMLFIVLNVYVNIRKRFSLFEKVIFTLVAPLGAAFIIIGANVMPSPYFDIVNKLLNTRYNITREFMSVNPITLFGVGYCDKLIPAFNNLDSSYVYALMHYGIIFFALMMAGLVGLIIYLLRNDRRTELGITLSLMVAAISEPFFVNTSFKNVCWFFMGEFLYYELAQIRKSKEYTIIDLKSKTISLPVNAWNDKMKYIGEKLGEFWVKKLIIALIFGIIIAFVSTLFITKTEIYYIKRENVQIDDEAYVTIDINNMPVGDEEAKIINYVDTKTPMQRFTEDIVWVEYDRKLLSVALWSAIVIYYICSFLIGGRRKRV